MRVGLVRSTFIQSDMACHSELLADPLNPQYAVRSQTECTKFAHRSGSMVWRSGPITHRLSASTLLTKSACV